MAFKRILLRPYSVECGGARRIVEILNDMGIESKRIYSKERFAPEPGDFIVNWGASYPPDWVHALTSKNKVFNHWSAVGNSVSKLYSFRNFKANGIPTPDWTENQGKALVWLEQGYDVCARTEVHSYDGKGLVLLRAKKGDLVWAPLYTKFIESDEEFRVYVVKGEFIDGLYKYPKADSKSDIIRTETNGWEYGRAPEKITKKMKEIAVAAIEANGMDFGGVDIIKDLSGDLFVLETNSEPGIGHITAKRFADAFRREAGL